ncbi:MAG: serine/threonine protein kinase [Deltaproteobacteria bacterium]|nr:serine/threonine protein kinase [Deltaproteobacteria bacterium]
MRIGNYTLQEKIEESGIIKRYSGFRISDNLPVTINLLLEQHLSDDTVRRRLMREYNSARAVDSPHVVRYLDFVEKKKTIAIVTEALPSMSLRSYLAIAKSLSVEKIVELSRNIALGLHACHLVGVVHRDVTPENIFIAPENMVKIANFSLASAVNATTLTMTGTMIGSPEYAPPENLYKAPRDIRGDIYSLGIICWEMLTGQNPFEGNSITEIISKKNETHLEKPSGYNPDVPPWLELLVDEMTASDPRKRMSSLSEVLVSLETEKHPKHSDINGAGTCSACGYPLMNRLYFCPYCGKSTTTSDPDGDNAVLLLTSFRDKENTARLLEETFVVEPYRDIRQALKKLPLPLLENTSADENNWLVETLDNSGCATEIRPMAAWYYKLSAFIVFCLVSICYIIIYVYPEASNELSEIPAKILSKYTLIKSVAVFFMAAIMLFSIRLHYASLWKLPKVLIKGAITFDPLSKNVAFHLGFLSSALVIASSVFFIHSAADAIVSIVRIVAVRASYNLWLEALKFPVFNNYSLITYKYVPFIALLVIYKLIIGRIYYPPLFRFRKKEATDTIIADKSEFYFLEKLREPVLSITNKEFRYIIAKGIKQYMQFILYKDKAKLNPGATKELAKKMNLAMDTLSEMSDQVKTLAVNAADEVRQKAEQQQVRLKHHIAQSISKPSEAIMLEWKKNQDRLIQHESAVELLAEFINRLRMLIGGMGAATMQMAGAVSGDLNEKQDIRLSLAILSETLKTLAPFRKTETLSSSFE